MDAQKAALVLRQIEKMPSLSPTVAKIIQVANDPTSSANDLNKVITVDPVLAAKVLKLVNSAYFGFTEKVTSTVRAIVMLGLNTIKNLALSTAAVEAMTVKDNTGLNMDEFWRHLLATGVCAKLIARKIGIHKNFVEDYFLAGMMHDIGKIILNSLNPVGYQKIVEAASASQKPLHLYESAIFGINHGEVGELLGKKWNLQNALMESMAFHHNIEKVTEENRRIVYSVFISNIFVKQMEIGSSGNKFIDVIPDNVWTEVGITQDVLVSLEGYLLEGLDRASIFLQTKN